MHVKIRLDTRQILLYEHKCTCVTSSWALRGSWIEYSLWLHCTSDRLTLTSTADDNSSTYSLVLP